jgi:predicted nucleotidyltransferase component of viral defense system
MGLTAAQAKGRIKNIALKNGADPRVLMRIYMMERFLERVSLSPYKDNFIIKGGMLITSMVGISMRTTMDIDTTVKGQDLSLENAQRIVKEIAELQIDDGVSFTIKDVETIMDEMEYPGIRFHLDTVFEKMVTPIKIDVSTGDAITPRAIEYNYRLMLEDREIELWSYNLETILGEKLQTILVRERANTRMRDFYDICVLVEMYSKNINVDDFKAAYEATCQKRESLHLIGNEEKIIDIIARDSKLKDQWTNYQKKFSYASDISFEKTINCAKTLILFFKKQL